MYTTEKSWSTQTKLEDVLQDSLAHSTCWQPCSPLKRIRASRRKKPSSPSIAHTGVLMLLLYRPASLVPPYLVKQTLPAMSGRNFVCICARGSVCTPAHNNKNLKYFILVLLYHLLYCKGNSITIILSNCTFILESKMLILEVAQSTLYVDIWPCLHYKGIVLENGSLDRCSKYRWTCTTSRSGIWRHTRFIPTT